MSGHAVTDERGAIAVLTAILAFLLFGVSALAVDLGNMYARGGDAQKAADLAALAGAAAFVNQDDGRATVSASDAKQAAYASLEQNAVYSDGSGFGLPGVSQPVWTNGDESDGEIAVDDSAMRVTVVVPPRTVHFGLAAIFGLSESTVTARAVAEVRAPGQLLPFYLPDDDGCRTGPQFMAVPPEAPGPFKFLPPVDHLEPESPVLVPGTVAMDAVDRVVIIVGDKFEPDGMRVRFTRGNQTETAESTEINFVDIDFDALGQDRLEVQVPDPVATTPGEWAIRVENSYSWSTLEPPYLLLAIPESVINECAESPAGDLGLFTPHSGETDLTLNLVNGLSEELRVGDEVTIDPQNLTVEATTDGLVGRTGRLAVPPTPGCGTQLLRNVHGTWINNDVLSCFIDNSGHGGHSIEGTLTDDCDGFPADLNVHPGRSLQPSIFNSPRFFFVPVLDAPIAPKTSNDTVPVREFRAVFLTDETEGGGDGFGDPVSDSTDQNGIDLAGPDIGRLQVFAFCPDELPNAVEEGGNGFPWQPGLPTAIRLVQ